jgi:hypothetical protein
MITEQTRFVFNSKAASNSCICCIRRDHHIILDSKSDLGCNDTHHQMPYITSFQAFPGLSITCFSHRYTVQGIQDVPKLAPKKCPQEVPHFLVTCFTTECIFLNLSGNYGCRSKLFMGVYFKSLLAAVQPNLSFLSWLEITLPEVNCVRANLLKWSLYTTHASFLA